MAISPEVMKLRLDSISNQLGYILRHKGDTYEQFIADERNPMTVFKAIENIAQGIIDICNHIAASKHWGVADSYREAVAALMLHGLLEKELTERLQELISMRNILIHQYLDTDYELVWKSIPQLVEDVQSFIQSIKVFINSIR